MNCIRRLLSLRFSALVLLGPPLTFTGLAPAWCSSLRLQDVELPPGFAIELYAKVPGARSMDTTAHPQLTPRPAPR
jgi:hypothetical protein